MRRSIDRRAPSQHHSAPGPTATAAATPAPPGRTEQLGFKPQVACQQLINNVDGAILPEIEKEGEEGKEGAGGSRSGGTPRCVLRGPAGGQQPSPGRGCLGAAAQPH